MTEYSSIIRRKHREVGQGDRYFDPQPIPIMKQKSFIP